MSIFNLFRKQIPGEDVYEAIVQGIIWASLQYRKYIEKYIEITGNQSSDYAGAEMAYFLLHMLDRQLLKEVGVPARDKIFDKVAVKVLADYVEMALKPETPVELALQLGTSMFHTLNERQRIYSNCKCLFKGLGVAKGSIVFALSFYTHKALRKTDRNDVDDILCGKRDIDVSELDDFPDVADTTVMNIFAMNTHIESVKIWRKLIKLIPL